ncbi:MAG: pentapeptide repeat-containing protein [Planctomycetaceae bacterium]|nr:pentapeptide repeat-containing protein [Planctomycetaceae bacterium]
MNPSVANPSLANPGSANLGSANPGVGNAGILNPSVANPGVANPGVVNPNATPTVATEAPANSPTVEAGLQTTNSNPAVGNLVDTQAVEQIIDRRTELNATTNRLTSTTNQASGPVRSANTIGDIDLAGPIDSEANTPPDATLATIGQPTENLENRDSRNQAVGQSFRVQVVDEEPNHADQEELERARLASSQAMVNAIQQVTQQGVGRLANNRSNSEASPALANLLLDQVQNSISANQVQQASLALQNLEGSLDVPAFDLNSNRPVSTAQEATNRVAGPNVASANTPVESQAVVANTNAAAVQIAWRPAIQQAIRSIEHSVSQATDPQEKQSLEIYLRLLQLIAHDPEQAVRNIDSLPKNRQNFWREQIFALSQIIQAPEADQEVMFVNHSRQATKALAHLQNAVESLKNEATLQVRQVQFCQEIRSFGDYDLARSTLVSAGDPLLIYCEVFNYSAQRLNDANGDHFQTSLVPSYMIVDSQQQVVSQKEFPAVRDRCRSRRQDFYLVLQVEVPNLPPGKYHLQVNVEDLEAGKIAPAAPLTFQIHASR